MEMGVRMTAVADEWTDIEDERWYGTGSYTTAN
jgi:hypothetical protein